MTDPAKESKKDRTWELDIRGIQRAITPYMVLKVLKNEQSGLIGLRLKDRIEEKLERDLSELKILIPRYEIFVSVLYPMLGYMKADERKWITLDEQGYYRISPTGESKLIEWSEIINAITRDLT